MDGTNTQMRWKDGWVIVSIFDIMETIVKIILILHSVIELVKTIQSNVILDGLFTTLTLETLIFGLLITNKQMIGIFTMAQQMQVVKYLW